MMYSKVIRFVDKIDQKITGLSDKQKYLIMFLVAFFTFCILLLLNNMTHLQGDDYIYSFKYPTFEKIKSFDDLIVSQYNHYMLWGGRTIAHIIAQLLLLCSPLVIDIMNSIIFIVFMFGIYLHAKGNNKEQNISFFLLIFLLTWYLQPAFADTTLSVTSGANYLWCFTIAIYFLLPFRLYENSRKSRLRNPAIALCILFGGIIAGWTNENISFAIIIILIGWVIYYKKNKWDIPIAVYLGIIGCITGFLFMILAPGNYVRAEEMHTPSSIFYYSYRIRLHTLEFFQTTGFFNALLLVLFILVVKFTTSWKRNFVPVTLIYSVGIFFGLYAMVLSPFFPARAWFGIIMLNIILVGIVIFNLNYKERFIRFIVYSLAALALLVFPFSFYIAYKDIKRVDNVWEERESQITKSVNERDKPLIFESVGNTNRFIMGDYKAYEKYMSEYYGIEIILQGAN